MTISLGLQSSRKATSRSHPEVTCAPLRNCSLKACLLGLVLFRLLHERLPERSAMPDERGACVCGNREACESVHRSELHLLKRYVAWIRSILSYMDWHPIKHASRHFISNGLSPPPIPRSPSLPFPFALCFSYSPLSLRWSSLGTGGVGMETSRTTNEEDISPLPLPACRAVVQSRLQHPPHS